MPLRSSLSRPAQRNHEVLFHAVCTFGVELAQTVLSIGISRLCTLFIVLRSVGSQFRRYANAKLLTHSLPVEELRTFCFCLLREHEQFCKLFKLFFQRSLLYGLIALIKLPYFCNDSLFKLYHLFHSFQCLTRISEISDLASAESR